MSVGECRSHLHKNHLPGGCDVCTVIKFLWPIGTLTAETLRELYQVYGSVVGGEGKVIQCFEAPKMAAHMCKMKRGVPGKWKENCEMTNDWQLVL